MANQKQNPCFSTQRACAATCPRHADIFTSRVSNFLRYTPFEYFRSPAQLLVHDRPTADPLVLSSTVATSSSDPDTAPGSYSYGPASVGQKAASLGPAIAAAAAAASAGAAAGGSGAADAAPSSRPSTTTAAAGAGGRSPLTGSAARSSARRRAGQ